MFSGYDRMLPNGASMVSGLAETLNNTYAWELGPPARIYELIPPREYGPADPVPEWNAWYMAPGWRVESRHIMDQYTNYKRLVPQVGVNPWDSVFGPIGADAGLRAGAARYFRSQQGFGSMV